MQCKDIVREAQNVEGSPRTEQGGSQVLQKLVVGSVVAVLASGWLLGCVSTADLYTNCSEPCQADRGGVVPEAVARLESSVVPSRSAADSRSSLSEAKSPPTRTDDSSIRSAKFEQPEPVAPEQTKQERNENESADAVNSTLKVSPVPEGGRGIDLASALELAAGQSPEVQYAQWRIHEAYANWVAAKVLWLPTIHAGLSYNRHDGTLQSSSGAIRDTNRSSFQTGLGVGSVGTGSPPVAGVGAQFALADAVFQPRIASNKVAARQFGADATTNDTLLDVAVAYLDLLEAVQEKAIAEETLKNVQELAKLTDAFAKTGQGAQADADRVRAELAVRRNEVHRAEERIRTRSARLAQLLSLDPSVPFAPREPEVTPIELVSTDAGLRDLVAQALQNRPELSEAQYLVSAAVEELRRERFAPLLPSFLLRFSYSGFGGGNGSTNAGDSFDDRVDYDAVAYWEIRNLGFGEWAERHAAETRLEQKEWRLVRVMDRVSAEVSEAYAQVEARKPQIETARDGLRKALDSLRRNMDRIRSGEGLPIEALQSIQALDQARREYLRAVIDYNKAQFALHHALGWPSR